jgi:hypothetical protein
LGAREKKKDDRIPVSGGYQKRGGRLVVGGSLDMTGILPPKTKTQNRIRTYDLDFYFSFSFSFRFFLVFLGF